MASKDYPKNKSSHFEWDDEKVLEFAKASTTGTYGDYQGCKTLKLKMERFKILTLNKEFTKDEK